jgi:hypothetical protein
MKRRNPPFVHVYESRHGTTVYYLRKPGHPKVRLRIPDGVLPWSPSFMAIYETAMAEAPAKAQLGAGRTIPGTVNAAIVSYYGSTAFAALAKSTQGNRRAILESFRNDHGDRRTALMHTQAMQNILNSKTAIVQRNWRKALRGLVDHCLSLGMMKVDPLAGVKLAKTKKSTGFHTWSEDEITAYRKRHAPGTKARLALELILQTGHARADAVRMGSQHVKGGKLSMRRQKTGVAFDIPLLSELVAELALHSNTDSNVEQLAFLITEQGQPFTAAGFGDWFADRCREAGVPAAFRGGRTVSARPPPFVTR